MKKLILLLASFIILLGCDYRNQVTESITLTAGNYNWNSYRVSQIQGGLDYSAMQLPNEYYLLKNIGVKNRTELDSLQGSMKNERVIVAEFRDLAEDDILKKEFTNRSYEEAVKYLAFQIQKDYSLVTGSNDSVPCIGVHFERNFKVAPFKRVLLYFDNVPENENIELIYKDNLFGNGTLKFNLNQEPLKS